MFVSVLLYSSVISHPNGVSLLYLNILNGAVFIAYHVRRALCGALNTLCPTLMYLPRYSSKERNHNKESFSSCRYLLVRDSNEYLPISKQMSYNTVRNIVVTTEPSNDTGVQSYSN